MLRYKHGMPLRRSLLPVIRDYLRGHTPGDEVPGMAFYDIQPFFVNLVYILLLQMKAASEFGFPQPVKQLSIPLFFSHRVSF